MNTLIKSEIIRKTAHGVGLDSIGFQFIERDDDEKPKSIRRIAAIFSLNDTEEDVARKLEHMAESIRTKKNIIYDNNVLTGNEINFNELSADEKEAYLSADNF